MNRLQQAVAAVMLTACSSAAFAQTVPAFSPTIPGGDFAGVGTGNGPLIVAVWDVITGSSLTQWLGLGYNDVSIPAMSDSDYLNFGTLSGFNTTFASAIAAGQTSRLQYMVFAADPLTTDGIAGAGIRATGAANYASAVQTGGDPISFALIAPTASTGWVQSTWQPTTDADNQCLSVNPCAVVGNANSGRYWANTVGPNGPLGPGADLNGSIPATTSFAGSVGSALSFYQTTVSFSDDIGNYIIDPILVATGIGNQWLLSATGQLTYGAESPVPLPAAAWLLLSGLAGLGAVSRRRQAA